MEPLSPNPEPADEPASAERRLRHPPRRRMKSSREFQRVYREGNRARGALMTVAVAENGLADTRLGLSVGRAVWRGAVKRNRVRRLFREAFRLEYPRLPPGVDVVVIAGKEVWPELGAARAELVRLSWKAWRRYREKLECGPPAGGDA